MKIRINENQLKRLINQLTEQTEDEKLNVLFVGDSLSNGPSFTWNYLLANEHPEWNVEHLVEGAKRTDWMLDNLSLELSENKYDMVFIYGGTNDMFSQIPISTAIRNIQKMVDLVVNQGGKAYVFSGYDAKSVLTDESLKPTDLCDLDCMKKGRDRMVEFQKQLQTISDAVIIPVVVGNETWTTDGIHLPLSKNKILKDFVSNYIESSPSKTKGGSSEGFMEKLNKLIKKTFTFNTETELVDELKTNLKKLKDSNKNLEYQGKIVDDNDVFFFQTALQALKFSLPVWGIDGLFGPETERAVRKFQNSIGLDETGVVDGETIQKLIDELEKNNIKDEDLEKLQIQRTETMKPEDIESNNEMISKVSSESSKINTFKKILEENNVDYDDFLNDVESIGLTIDVVVNQLWAESRFSPEVINCNRKSSAGAMGIAQFIPSTWSTYGGSGDPCNVADSLEAYVKLMRDLMKKFNGRIDLVLSGYNWGPNRNLLTQAMKENQTFEEIEDQLPNETKNYVNQILGSSLNV